ncbi:hypothetical protein VISI1226_10637 [Vibrio sinaloensis DSM 21326]|uniref:Probable membrane transporter protein n=1 Tax=Vibrio sinaloensis DSM 21326 TaxID=945550 RepID=E8MAU9_PHOS4|nr:sulfite exporter TauE/SafE family protein [Vibrio sinaloensis]EGA68779.1 hypothetical protein VISI1226_10637 [Vibrio sinaloensis DSM 21326]
MEWILLLGAGIVGGVINSIAGGGSFFTFPALMFVGLPPVVANATNTFAACAGYISGTYGFKKDIVQHTDKLIPIILWSLLGGGLGAYLLLSVDESVFVEAIPWLLLFATLLFLYGQQLNQWFASFAKRKGLSPIWATTTLAICLVLVSAYGGFFNAGLGVIVLSYLVLAGYTDINQMNGLKLLVSSSVSLVAIVIFVMDGSIDWLRGTVVMLGTLIGGYAAARLSRNVAQQHVKMFVAFSSALMTAYFFYDTYLSNTVIH